MPRVQLAGNVWLACPVQSPATHDLEGPGNDWSQGPEPSRGVNAGHIVIRDDAAAGAIARFVRADALADLLRQAGLEIFELPIQG